MLLIFGILNFLLILWQLSTGMRWIKVSFRTHRGTGIALLLSAAIHGGLALLA